MASLFAESYIDSFDGEYEFLSNFFECYFVYKGVNFISSEHAYQWSKATDLTEAQNILYNSKTNKLTTPGQAKKLGKQCAKRYDWQYIKVDIMEEILMKKFMTGTFRRKHVQVGLKKLLINTGSKVLIEGNNWHDNFWGACNCKSCSNKHKENMLGKLLMKVRYRISV